MAAQVSAKNLGGTPPELSKPKPYRKLKAAKKQPLVTGPMSSETLALMGVAMRQLAETKRIPEPVAEDSINQRRRAKAKREKEIAARQVAKAKHSDPEESTPKAKKSATKKVKAKQKPKKSKPKAEASIAPPTSRLQYLRDKHNGGRPGRSTLYSQEALTLVGGAVEFDVMRFISLLKTGDTVDAYLYVRVCCDNKPQVVSYVLSQHVDVIRKASLSLERTEYGKVVPRLKSEAAVHPEEKVWTSHVRSRKKLVHLASGKTLVRKQRKMRMVSQGNLDWIELHYPIDAKCDLLITSREGVALSTYERRCITEPQPVFIGDLKIGVELVTQYIDIPLPVPPSRAKAGHLPYPVAAMRAMERTHRSGKKRARLGFPRVPDGTLFEEESITVTVGEVPVAANDDTPWDDDLPPSAAAVVVGVESKPKVVEVVLPEHELPVVADTMAEDHTTFFNEVVLERKKRQRYLQKKHFASQRRKELQLEIDKQKALKVELGDKFARISEALKIKRIRAQFKASWSEPNYHAEISHPPKQPLVLAVTHNNRAHHYHGVKVSARVRTQRLLRCPPTGVGHRLLMDPYDWCGFQPTTRETFHRIFQQEMREQEDYTRKEAWLKAGDITRTPYHDDERYDRWCDEAERKTHVAYETSYGLQMYLLNKECTRPSIGRMPGADSTYDRGKELFRVQKYEHIEIRLGRVASLEAARRKRLDQLKEQNDREAAAEEAAKNLETTTVNLSDALSGGQVLTALTDDERKVYFDALAGRRVIDLPFRETFGKLKTAVTPDLDMARAMFNHWVPRGEGGIFLPPDKS